MCPAFGPVSTSIRRRRTKSPHDLTYGDAPPLVRWHKVQFACREVLCDRSAFTEQFADVPALPRCTPSTPRWRFSPPRVACDRAGGPQNRWQAIVGASGPAGLLRKDQPHVASSPHKADVMMSKAYNSPPNWPKPSEAWIPPSDWTPDPSWGPAPEGWQFYVDDANSKSLWADPEPGTKRPKSRIITGFTAASVLISPRSRRPPTATSHRSTSPPPGASYSAGQRISPHTGSGSRTDSMRHELKPHPMVSSLDGSTPAAQPLVGRLHTTLGSGPAERSRISGASVRLDAGDGAPLCDGRAAVTLQEAANALPRQEESGNGARPQLEGDNRDSTGDQATPCLDDLIEAYHHCKTTGSRNNFLRLLKDYQGADGKIVDQYFAKHIHAGALHIHRRARFHMRKKFEIRMKYPGD